MENKIVLIVTLLTALIIIMFWIFPKEKKAIKDFEFTERNENLYRKHTHCICKKPIINNDTIVCLECGYEFTDESNLKMRNCTK